MDSNTRTKGHLKSIPTLGACSLLLALLLEKSVEELDSTRPQPREIGEANHTAIPIRAKNHAPALGAKVALLALVRPGTLRLHLPRKLQLAISPTAPKDDHQD